MPTSPAELCSHGVRWKAQPHYQLGALDIQYFVRQPSLWTIMTCRVFGSFKLVVPSSVSILFQPCTVVCACTSLVLVLFDLSLDCCCCLYVCMRSNANSTAHTCVAADDATFMSSIVAQDIHRSLRHQPPTLHIGTDLQLGPCGLIWCALTGLLRSQAM